MSQSVSFLDLGGSMGLSGAGGKQGGLEQMLESLGAEGKTFADLLDSEFAQLLDPEMLEQALNGEDLSPEAQDSLLPLLALLGGNALPLEDVLKSDKSLSAQSNIDIKSLQQALKNIEAGLQEQKAGSLLPEKLAVSLETEEGGDAAVEEFMKHLQLAASKIPQPASASQQVPLQLNNVQSVQQSGLIPVPAAQTVQTPPGQPGWDAQLGQRLIWMVGNEIKTAEIKLNPAELGPMEVKVRTEGDKVHVSFHVLNAPVREAIEQSIPRLREAFSGQGMDLLNVNVSQQDTSQHEHTAEQGDAQSSGFDDADVEGLEAIETETPSIVSGRGLVDYYI